MQGIFLFQKKFLFFGNYVQLPLCYIKLTRNTRERVKQNKNGGFKNDEKESAFSGYVYCNGSWNGSSYSSCSG